MLKDIRSSVPSNLVRIGAGVTWTKRRSEKEAQDMAEQDLREVGFAKIDEEAEPLN